MRLKILYLTAFWGLLPALAASPATESATGTFTFVENLGQFRADVRYVGKGTEFTAWFRDHSVSFVHGPGVENVFFEHPSDSGSMPSTVYIRVDNPTRARVNYLYGDDPRKWRVDIPLFGTIRYTELWPGVELAYSADNGAVKAEYSIKAGFDVSEICLRFEGEPEIHTDGSLRIHKNSGDLIEEAPLLYQIQGGVRRSVPGGFRVLSSDKVGFWVGTYDHSKELIIDPRIVFSGYFGGSSEDNITATAIDTNNNTVVAGWTTSNALPVSGSFDSKYAGGTDAFVASFLPNGGGLIYCTYMGGGGDDRAFALALDSSNSVYITGWTSSVNFPHPNAYQTRLSGTRDAFVAKLSTAGNALLYSTYLGGSGVDAGYSIALTKTNAAIIVGDTTSTNFPVSAAAFQSKSGGSQDAFVAEVAPGGNTLVMGTYLGGSGIDHASSVKVGISGGIFIGGYTWSNNFPVLAAFQPVSGGGQDGFITKMYPDGTAILWSTYLGGHGGSSGEPEEVNALCMDAAHNILVAGTTSSANFPTTAGSVQTAFSGQTDGFIARFNNNGLLLQSTYLGGSSVDAINAMALDFHGNPYVTGYTLSSDFPTQHPTQNTIAGSFDAFIVKLNPSLSSQLFSSYLGGSGSESANAIAVDLETSIVVAGQTGSGDFPLAGNLQSSVPSVLSSFLTKISPSFTFGVSYGYLGQTIFVADPWHVSSYLSSTAYGNSTDLPIVGDWTGTGTKQIGVFRNGTWYLDTNNNGILDASDKTVAFGQAGDTPVVGDWRGTGRIALGLFRQGTFILDLSGHLIGVPTGQSDATFVFGQGGDIPIVADWSGTGTSKVGVFRNGLWIEDYSGGRVYNSSANRSYTYGQAGDLPVVGDWDSSGNPPKIGIFRQGLWVLDYDGDNTWTTPGLNEMTFGLGFTGNSPLVF